MVGKKLAVTISDVKEVEVKDFRGGRTCKGTEGHLKHTWSLFASLVFSPRDSSHCGDDMQSSHCRSHSLACIKYRMQQILFL